jgi:hypothetical protein
MDPGDGDGFYVVDKRSFVPTILTQGPWDPGAQHGGPVAGLLTSIVEATPSLVSMQVARLTVDLLRPVPLEPLEFERQVVREGKRIQAVDVQLLHGSDMVARASALRIRLGADLSAMAPPAGPDIPGPESAEELEPAPAYVPGVRRAVDVRIVPEALVPGRQVMWLRVGVPVLAGHRMAPVPMLAVVADFTSLAGLPAGARAAAAAINGDLNLHVLRPPEGPWIALEGRTTFSAAGIGQSSAVLSDLRGPVAVASCAQVVDPKP